MEKIGKIKGWSLEFELEEIPNYLKNVRYRKVE
jgi:hypothetical protein